MPRSSPSHRRNGSRGQGAGGRAGRGAWLAPIIGATLIVAMAAAASLPQATPEIFVIASIVFSLVEGIILAFIGCIWSSRGTVAAVLAAAITAVLAAPGRWQVAQARTGITPQPMDLVIDLAVSVAWGAFAGLAGATILRERLSALLPGD